MLNFLNFGPFHFLTLCRWWLLLGGRRRVPAPSTPTACPEQELSGAFSEASLVPRPASGGGGWSPAAPSHQAGPAPGFHSYSRARFQFPNQVLQAAAVPITTGHAGDLLSSPILPCSPFPTPWWICPIYPGLPASFPTPGDRPPPGSWAGMAFCATWGQIFLEVLQGVLPPPHPPANTSSFPNTTRCQRLVLKLGKTSTKQGLLLFWLDFFFVFFLSCPSPPRNDSIILAKNSTAASRSGQAKVKLGCCKTRGAAWPPAAIPRRVGPTCSRRLALPL